MIFGMSGYEIFVQSLGFVAFAIFMAAYQMKDPRKTQMTFVPGQILYGIQYVLLGSLTGAFVMFAVAMRDVISVYCSQKTLKIVSAIYLVSIWAVTLLMFKSWYEFFMPVAGILSTIAVLYRDNFVKYRLFLAGRQLMTLLFNTCIGSQGGILNLLFTLGSNIVGTYRHYHGEKSKGAP